MKRIAVLITFTLAVAACSSGGDDGASTTVDTDVPASATPATESAGTDPVGTEPVGTDAEPATSESSAEPVSSDPPDTGPETGFAGTIELDVESPERCEVVGESCLLPFPSDALTVPDDTSVTGLRVNLSTESMPANADGVNVDTARQNRNDGFSPGSAALVLVPGVDPEASALPPVTDIARSLDADSGSVIVDATTGETLAHWAELDATATDDARRGLFLRPATNYANGHRIVVGLRNLVDADGNPIEPTDAFRAYRDRLESDVPEVEARRDQMEQVFADLEAAGVDRDELTIAWDFTVISTENLTNPLVHMRDDAFEQLGDASPTFTITSSEVEIGETDPAEQRRVVDGTYEVPLYLEAGGASGTGLNLPDGSDVPEANGSITARFRCQITEASTADDPGAGLVYGHGLLGTEGQVTSAGPTLVARNHNYVVCGTALIGMAEEDTGNAAASLVDPGNFSTLVDRLLQGHLNTLFLGRLMKHPDGFVSDPAFRSDDGRPLLDVEQLSYYGISQGGIMGPVATAISPDWDRGAFGVPGINYSTLLNRSVDFDTFQQILDPAFPDKLDQAVVLLAIQMLWDRGEGSGYAAYFREPLDGMNQKFALIQGALGDFQVANVAMDVMARTMGASVGAPDVRSTDVEPFWGIDRIESYPFDGSAVFLFDSGTPLPPVTNTPPREGVDPHEDVRRAASAYDQVAAFLRPDGVVIDTCGGSACIIEPRG
ncbi:MAG: hypothetical protein ABJH68_03405 [Ilumatobacter sp.]|uniref:hypothetical protein n=1 Tax=Ilumatobacter sp. TaxID=1967498 RepID=UPI003298D051